MLLEALAACAGVTLRGRRDLARDRGPLRAGSTPRATSTSAAPSPSTATRRSASRRSGFASTSTPTPARRSWRRCCSLTERYCVVFQTLSSPPRLSAEVIPSADGWPAPTPRRTGEGAGAETDERARRRPGAGRARGAAGRHCPPASRSNGSGSPATASATRGRRSSSTPTSRGCRCAACCCAARPCPTRRPSTASSGRPARSSASSSATPTSTTRSTRPAIAARFGCRAYGSRLAGQPDGAARPRRAGGRGRALPHLRARPVRGLLHPQRPLEAAARPRRPLRRRPHLRAPRRALPQRLPLRPGLGDLDRGRRDPPLPPGQRQPDRRRDRRASADVDVFLAGVAGRSFTDDYWKRILPLLDPRTVVPTHYDNFFRPLGSELEFVANVQLSELPEEIGAVSRDIELAALPRSDRAQDEGSAGI